MLWRPEHTVNTWNVKAFARAFILETELPELGANWHFPFPRKTSETSLTMKSACPRNLDCKLWSCVAPAFFPSEVLHITVLQQSMAVLSPWDPQPGPQACKVVQVQQMMLLWVRFLHYTAHGPPWHSIPAIIISREWYKRDLPLKAFSGYLTAVHQSHQSERASNNTKKIPRPCRRSLYDSSAELRNITAIPVGAVRWCCWNLFGLHPELLGQH